MLSNVFPRITSPTALEVTSATLVASIVTLPLSSATDISKATPVISKMVTPEEANVVSKYNTKRIKDPKRIKTGLPHAKLLTSDEALKMLEEMERKKQEEIEMKEKWKSVRGRREKSRWK